MNNKIQIKVFLASPMDLEQERAQFQSVLKSINENEGASLNAEFVLLCWENNTHPGLNEDAQAVVNRQLRSDYDVFVCLFRDRIGTPTNRTISGTVEEYERARLRVLKNPNLEIMAYYFESETFRPEIQQMKNKMGEDGALYCEVRRTDSFEELVRKHLMTLLSNHLSRIKMERKKLEAMAPQNAASVAIVFDSKVLLVQRSDSCRHGAGTWQIPGGCCEAGEAPEETAIREIKEELSYTIKNPDQLIKINTFTTVSEDFPNKPFNMTLFIHRANKKFKPKLNKENKSFEWMSLSCCDFGRKTLFPLNDRMLRSVWREIYLTAPLRAVLGTIQGSGSTLLPSELPNVTDSELNTAYAMLSLLGVADSDRGMVLSSSRYGKKLIEEFVSMLSEGDCIFKDDKNALPSKSANFSYEAIEQLKTIRSNAFCSNDALITHLSCDTMIDNSVRSVCDTLLFGDHNGKKYILLRWDFFANKYQLIGKGLEKVAVNDESDKVDAVLSSRLPSLKHYFDYVFVSKYEGYHFSAGSVDNDPIWRKYLIDMAVLLPNNNSNTADILKEIERINMETKAKIEASVEITPTSAKDLKYFVWCEIPELLEKPTVYRGSRVSGFGDLLGHLGEKSLRSLCGNLLTSLQLSDGYPTDDSLDECKKAFERKYVKG